MAKLGCYCKAYGADDLRRFPGWEEKAPPLTVMVDPEPPAESSANGDSPDSKAQKEEYSYYYLQENYIVTAGIYLDENVAFDSITEEWKDFCKNQLNFEIPDYAVDDPEPVELAAAAQG
jgi:hypothetical protein